MNRQESCPRIEELSALLDNELGEPERVALKAHVACCDLCAGALVQFRQLHEAFAALPGLSPGVDLAALVDGRIDAAAGTAVPASRPKRSGWWLVAPAALGSALSLGLGANLGSVLMLGAQARVQPASLQMVAFAANPPGALCPVLRACNTAGH